MDLKYLGFFSVILNQKENFFQFLDQNLLLINIFF